jgi:prenyltransferase beta subunit
MLALFFVDGTKTILECRDKENVEKKYNYIMKLLGEHGSFNRISFGLNDQDQYY